MKRKYYKLLKELQKIDEGFEIIDAVTYKVFDINKNEELVETMKYFEGDEEHERAYNSLKKLKTKSKAIKNKVFALIIREKTNPGEIFDVVHHLLNSIILSITFSYAFIQSIILIWNMDHWDAIEFANNFLVLLVSFFSIWQILSIWWKRANYKFYKPDKISTWVFFWTILCIMIVYYLLLSKGIIESSLVNVLVYFVSLVFSILWLYINKHKERKADFFTEKNAIIQILDHINDNSKNINYKKFLSHQKEMVLWVTYNKLGRETINSVWDRIELGNNNFIVSKNKFKNFFTNKHGVKLNN